MTDVEIHDDVPPRAANSALVGNAGNTSYETRAVLPIDLTGASGVMVLNYNASSGEVELAEITPTLASASATNAGRMWVANGAYYEDKLVKVVLLGNGAPSSGDGSDGFYWLDLAAMVEYGPKGTALDGTPDPGVWDVTNAGKGRQMKAELATLPYIVGDPLAATSPLVHTTVEIFGIANSTSLGTWPVVANGVEVPEDGIYEAELVMTVFESGAAVGNMQVRPLVDGLAVVPTGRVNQSVVISGWSSVTCKFGPVSLTAGDAVGFEVNFTGVGCIGNHANYGQISIRRIA